MTEIISAIIVSGATILLTRLLSKQVSAKLFAATILCSIAFIYVGFSLKENPVSLMILEISVALIFYFIAIIGYTRNNYLIAYGIILHGVWDILHHNFIPTNIPVYWPVFCILVDLITGIYFWMVFKRQKGMKIT